MGGNVALHFALAHPERVSALILADVGAGSDEGEAFGARVEALAAALERDGIGAFVAAGLANPLFARFTGRGPGAERLLRACLSANPARGLAHTARGVLARRPGIYALEPRLRELAVPTLLVVGEHDEPCRKPHRFMAETVPGAREVVLPDAGHLSNLEAPEAFDRAVEAFLADRPE
jgi:pimeloyl-ACP methyl ester carboxylesterase